MTSNVAKREKAGGFVPNEWNSQSVSTAGPNSIWDFMSIDLPFHDIYGDGVLPQMRQHR